MIDVDRTSSTPAYLQVYNSLRDSILSGELAPGDKLPALRTLARDLKVARNTIEGAYRQLVLEGFVKGRRGSGYVVEQFDASMLESAGNKAVGGGRGGLAAVAPNLSTSEDNGFAGPVAAPLSQRCRYDFCYGDRTRGGFPAPLWRSLVDEALAGDPVEAGAYTNPAGLPGLRAQVAARVSQTQQTACSAENVVLLPGVQVAIDQLVTLLLNDPDRAGRPLRVAFEDPGYRGAREVFANRGCELVPVSVLDGAEMLDDLLASGADLFYCTPSHQFPTGHVMPLRIRLQVIEWAAATGALIVEDDCCREYRYGAKPVPSLSSFDSGGHVAYLNTFSKVLSPAVRLAYLVLPDGLRESWHRLFDGYHCAVPWLEQEAVRRLLSRPDWARYERRTVNLHRRRHAALVGAIRRELVDPAPDTVEVMGSGAGLHLLLHVRNGMTQNELVRAAREHDVGVYPTRDLWLRNRPEADEPVVFLGFSAIEEEDIEPAVKLLREAWLPAARR